MSVMSSTVGFPVCIAIPLCFCLPVFLSVCLCICLVLCLYLLLSSSMSEWLLSFFYVCYLSISLVLLTQLSLFLFYSPPSFIIGVLPLLFLSLAPFSKFYSCLSQLLISIFYFSLHYIFLSIYLCLLSIIYSLKWLWRGKERDRKKLQLWLILLDCK